MAEQQKKLSDSVSMQKFSGLKNTVTSERLAPDELEIALNIDIDDVGQLHRRRGTTQVSAGKFHSIFTADNCVYGVKDSALGIINPDYSFKQIKSGLGSGPLAYVQVGDDVYFTSPTDSGIIHRDASVSPWGAITDEGFWLSPVVKPTENLTEIRGKLLGAPPMATELAYFNGRIYMAHGKEVWATELYLYNYVDKTRNYLTFETDVTVIGVVTDGLYVGTQNSVWFLSGSFTQMARILIMSYGALPGSMISLPAELVNPQVPLQQQAPSKNAVLFLSTSGLCAGMDSGVCYNLTQTQVLFPDAANVAAMFRRQDGINQYVGVTDSAGTPSSTARIGDYVDAEIIRFKGA